MRMRTCKNGDPGDIGCVGSVMEEEECSTQACPFFNDWTPWNVCSVTCGGGTYQRQRDCVNGNQGDEGCDGSITETKNCATQKCPAWSEWSQFNSCTASCGGGSQTKTRECINGSPGQQGCIGDTTNTQSCNPQSCPSWSVWSPFMICSQTCGSGVQSRVRECVSGNPGDVGCMGDVNEERECNTETCPHWSEWTEFSDCSVTCGSGIQRRQRECMFGEAGDEGCIGETDDTQVCNTSECPVCDPDYEVLGLENGVISCTNGNSVGSVCKFTCNNTHTIAGRNELICLTDIFGNTGWKATEGEYLKAPVCVERCSDALDIVVVLDSSSSIGTANFELMRGFLNTLVSSLNVAPEKTRVAAIRYNRKTHFLWDFDDYDNLDDMRSAIANIPYDGSGTHTGKALNYTRENILQPEAGARDGVAKVVVVITDGKSQDDVTRPAEILKSMNVLIAVVGIGRIDRSQISTIASEPISDFVTTVSDFGSLDLVVRGISKKISLCHDLRENMCTSDPVVDLLFIVDSSSSVGTENFEKVKQFVQYVTTHFQVGPDKTQIGLIRYNALVDDRFTLAQHPTNEQVTNAISTMPYNGSGTKTAQALLYAASNSLDAKSGRRPGVPAVVVVITDGKAQDSSELLSAAELLQSKANVVAIGIKGAQIQELNKIATDPDDKSVFSVFDFSALSGIIEALKNSVCLSTRTGLYRDPLSNE